MLKNTKLITLVLALALSFVGHPAFADRVKAGDVYIPPPRRPWMLDNPRARQERESALLDILRHCRDRRDKDKTPSPQDETGPEEE